MEYFVASRTSELPHFLRPLRRCKGRCTSHLKVGETIAFCEVKDEDSEIEKGAEQGRY
jgi:hypothetical protein